MNSFRSRLKLFNKHGQDIADQLPFQSAVVKFKESSIIELRFDLATVAYKSNDITGLFAQLTACTNNATAGKVITSFVPNNKIISTIEFRIYQPGGVIELDTFNFKSTITFTDISTTIV